MIDQYKNKKSNTDLQYLANISSFSFVIEQVKTVLNKVFIMYKIS